MLLLMMLIMMIMMIMTSTTKMKTMAAKMTILLRFLQKPIDTRWPTKSIKPT